VGAEGHTLLQQPPKSRNIGYNNYEIGTKILLSFVIPARFHELSLFIDVRHILVNSYRENSICVVVVGIACSWPIVGPCVLLVHLRCLYASLCV